MTDRKLTISFGDASSLAKIVRVEELEWDDFARRLTTEPPETADKASVGWYACAEYKPVYRDGDNFVVRHALTLDYDTISRGDVGNIGAAFRPYAHAIYTTHSHSAEKPRIRVVLPLSRPATLDEFGAVSRKIAAIAGIELASKESHVATQMMFLPAKRPGGTFKGKINEGEWVDVDGVLESYEDWTDRSSWPRRAQGDATHAATVGTAPNEKPGVVGDFCRSFDIPAAIERFELPYHRTENPNRYTFKSGSRVEGAVIYDDGQKIHIHHDSCPARGQQNSFDLVRLHRFGQLDAGGADDVPVAERPSYRAMAKFVADLPEIGAARASEELEDLGPLTEGDDTPTSEGLARRVCDVLKTPTRPRWLLTDIIEHGVIAVMAGRRGSYKSFIALDWSFRIALLGFTVYIVSAEGGDIDRRARAWLLKHAPDLKLEDVPLYIVERRLNLATKEGIDTLRNDCLRLGIHPALFVLDTYSKLSGGLEENDNTEVKQFVGRLDNGLKRSETGFGATVLLVAHTGHSDAGRPRGASALSADTDAEYIVARTPDGSVGVTRERFKSSPELTPLFYKVERLKLGYHDDKGEEITSLALEPTEHVSGGPARRPVASLQQRQALEIAFRYAVEGPIGLDRLIQLIIDASVKDPEAKRDRRRDNAVRAINQLLASGHLFKHQDDRVGLTNARMVNAVEMEELDEDAA